MIDIIATYFSETPPQIIFDIGTRDCLHTIELYINFQPRIYMYLIVPLVLLTYVKEI